jgi:UDP-GlcNAc:undecaprenyl-phosphate GlcNAc-1-phosphate transferase
VADVVALPLALSGTIALLLAPPLVATLRARDWTRPNNRGIALPHPTGLVLVVSSGLTVASLALLGSLTGLDLIPPGLPTAAGFVLGVALLGLIDDFLGDRVGSRHATAAPRGLRGHARALASGRPSTGVLKAAGTVGLAALVLSERSSTPAEYALAILVLALSAHVFNLLDLRPGRSIKAFLLLAAALALVSLDPGPLHTLGVFIGPILALLPPDLRARGMLGDTGASAIGAVAGLWIVMTLSTAGLAVVAVVLVAVALYGELRSITALVERTPLLRRIDSLGTHA